MYFPYSMIKLLKNKASVVERQYFIYSITQYENFERNSKNRLTNIYNTKRLNTAATDHSAHRPTNFLVYSYNSAKCFTPHLLPLNTTVSISPSCRHQQLFQRIARCPSSCEPAVSFHRPAYLASDYDAATACRYLPPRLWRHFRTMPDARVACGCSWVRRERSFGSETSFEREVSCLGLNRLHPSLESG